MIERHGDSAKNQPDGPNAAAHSPLRGEVTQLLNDWNEGEESALAQLMPMVYEELRQLAKRYLRKERPDHTLQATALVHEAYLRLVDQSQTKWQNSLHFYALAASMMRRILVDHARSHRASKRGGQLRRLSAEELADLAQGSTPDLLVLEEALLQLADFDKTLAKVVELRFFGGFRNGEIAAVLQLSEPTVRRKWNLAKAWLFRALREGPTLGA